MTERISVVVPLYNHAEYIGEALDSLLIQQGVHCEIIVVDDGSSDGGDVLVEQNYVSQGVRLIRQRRNGCGTTRALRRALAAATGEFICWLSADDWFLPQKLHEQVLAYADIFGEQDGVLHSSPGYVSYDLEHALKASHLEPADCQQQYAQQGYVRWQEQAQTPDLDQQLFYFFMFNYVNGITVFFRKRLLERYGAFSEAFPLTQDYELWFRLAYQGVPFHVMPQALSFSRMHAGNLGRYRSDIPAENAVISRLYAEMVQSEQLAVAQQAQGFHDPQLMLARLMQLRNALDAELWYLEQATGLDADWQSRAQFLRQQLGVSNTMPQPDKTVSEAFCLGFYLSETTLSTWRWYMCLTHVFQAFTADDPVRIVLYVPETTDLAVFESSLQAAMTQIEAYLEGLPDLELDVLVGEDISEFVSALHALIPMGSPDALESQLLYQARVQGKPLLYHCVPELLRFCLTQHEALPSDYRGLLAAFEAEFGGDALQKLNQITNN